MERRFHAARQISKREFPLLGRSCSCVASSSFVVRLRDVPLLCCLFLTVSASLENSPKSGASGSLAVTQLQTSLPVTIFHPGFGHHLAEAAIADLQEVRLPMNLLHWATPPHRHSLPLQIYFSMKVKRILLQNSASFMFGSYEAVLWDGSSPTMIGFRNGMGQTLEKLWMKSRLVSRAFFVPEGIQVETEMAMFWVAIRGITPGALSQK